MCLVDLGDQLLGQSLTIDLHGVAIGSSASTDGDIGKSLSCLVPLARQACDNAGGRVVLVEGGAKLLSRLRQLLLECVRLKDNGVPLVLEGAEERRD